MMAKIQINASTEFPIQYTLLINNYRKTMYHAAHYSYCNSINFIHSKDLILPWSHRRSVIEAKEAIPYPVFGHAVEL